MEDALEGLIGSPWVYAFVFGCLAGSAVFPPLPSDSLMVTALGLALAGELAMGWVVLAVLFGGWAGDLLAYTLGRALSGPARRGATTRGRARTALAWLEAREESWGPGLITVSRFVPGGTMAVGVSAGLLAYPLRSFVSWSGLGAVLWTVYGALVAQVGESLFPGNLWASLAVGIVIALAVGAVVHLASRRRNRQSGQDGPTRQGGRAVRRRRARRADTPRG